MQLGRILCGAACGAFAPIISPHTMVTDESIHKQAQKMMDDIVPLLKETIASMPNEELKNIAYNTIRGLVEKHEGETEDSRQFSASQSLVAFIAVGLPLYMAITIAYKLEILQGFQSSLRIFQEAGFITINPQFWPPSSTPVKDKCHALTGCTNDAVENCDNCGMLICASCERLWDSGNVKGCVSCQIQA